MSNYPMVDEVNRLVGNLLAAGSGVFLPGVGSLFVERRGARRLSKRSVQPPCRVVSFSSQQQGVSLADELARTLHCDAAGAQDVYDRWLSRTREGDVLTIEGVGVLKFKNFTLAPAFDRLLMTARRDCPTAYIDNRFFCRHQRLQSALNLPFMPGGRGIVRSHTDRLRPDVG